MPAGFVAMCKVPIDRVDLRQYPLLAVRDLTRGLIEQSSFEGEGGPQPC